MKMAAMSPASSRTTSHAAATAITAVVPSTSPSRPAEQQPEQRGAGHAADQADADAGRKFHKLAAGPLRVLAITAWNTSAPEDSANRVDQ